MAVQGKEEIEKTQEKQGEKNIRDVELRTARAAGRVQRNVLDPYEVVAGREARRDRDGHVAEALAGPREPARADVGALREDLEPDGARAVKGRGRLPGGDLGHVELEGARVRDARVGHEADLGARRHAHGLGALVPRGELVAAQLRRGHVRHGAVGLVVGRLADVLPVLRRGAVGDEAGELVCLGGSFSGLDQPVHIEFDKTSTDR